jgi:hypothetical protein
MRPLCQACGRNPAAINCYHRDKIYYRPRCNACIRRDRGLPRATPRWQSSGYKKKSVCDRCGFRSRHAAQLVVYHVNGDLNDCELRNLKTVCLNCIEEIKRLDLPWRRGDIEPDL